MDYSDPLDQERLAKKLRELTSRCKVTFVRGTVCDLFDIGLCKRLITMAIETMCTLPHIDSYLLPSEIIGANVEGEEFPGSLELSYEFLRDFMGHCQGYKIIWFPEDRLGGHMGRYGYTVIQDGIAYHAHVGRYEFKFEYASGDKVMFSVDLERIDGLEQIWASMPTKRYKKN